MKDGPGVAVLWQQRIAGSVLKAEELMHWHQPPFPPLASLHLSALVGGGGGVTDPSLLAQQRGIIIPIWFYFLWLKGSGLG